MEEPVLEGLPSGSAGRDKSPPDAALEGAGKEPGAPGNAGIVDPGSAMAGAPAAGRVFISVGAVVGRAGKPELSCVVPAAGVEGNSLGFELLEGRAGRPESGAPVKGNGGEAEVSEFKPSGAGVTAPLGAGGTVPAPELSAGNGSITADGLFSTPGIGGAELLFVVKGGSPAPFA